MSQSEGQTVATQAGLLGRWLKIAALAMGLCNAVWIAIIVLSFVLRYSVDVPHQEQGPNHYVGYAFAVTAPSLAVLLVLLIPSYVLWFAARNADRVEDDAQALPRCIAWMRRFLIVMTLWAGLYAMAISAVVAYLSVPGATP